MLWYQGHRSGVEDEDKAQCMEQPLIGDFMTPCPVH